MADWPQLWTHSAQVYGVVDTCVEVQRSDLQVAGDLERQIDAFGNKCPQNHGKLLE